MTANFQIRIFGHGTENFKKYSVMLYWQPKYVFSAAILISYTDLKIAIAWKIFL